MKLLILAACITVALARPTEVVVCEEETKYTGPLASEVELIDGLTPEVFEAREKHLRLLEEIRSTRPAEEEYVVREYVRPVVKTVKYVEPTVIVKKEKYPLASEIKLKDGLTPEVFAAREEHLRIKSEIERNLPKEETVEHFVPTVVRKEKYPLASEIVLKDGLTPEVFEAREEHLRLKSEIERNLPREEVTVEHFVPTVVKKEKYPLASEIELIDGLTPEVHAAREEHLRIKSDIERTLPTEETFVPTVVKKEKYPLASEINLIDGLTPEVFAAREEHLRIKSDIEKNLPKEEVTVEHFVPTVVKKGKYPLASEIELIDGLTPEVHAAREEHLRIKSGIESSLPPVEEDCYVEKKHFKTVELIDGLTPEVHAAREEHLRIKSLIESQLPKEEYVEPKPVVRTYIKYVEPTVVHKEKYPLASEVELIDGLTPEVHAAREEHLRIKSDIEKNLPKEPVVDC